MKNATTTTFITALVISPAIVYAQPINESTSSVSELQRLRAGTIQQKQLELARRLKEIDQLRRATLEAPTPSSAQRNEIAAELESWRKAQARFDAETICGPLDESVDVERYQGNLGPSKAFVDLHQPQTAQIQWNDDLQQRLGVGGDPGMVSGLRWCSGTLIADNVFLTAGHCFDIDSNGWKTPRLNGVPISPQEMPKYMKLNFGYQRPPTGTLPRAATVYPITRLIEHRRGGLDYAIIEVGRGANGEYPSKKFGLARIETSSSSIETASRLTVIQHPLGEPKKIAAGIGYGVNEQHVTYSDVDTQGGASGAGVINDEGRLIAIHVLGGCTVNGGVNSAVRLDVIRKQSPYFQALSN